MDKTEYFRNTLLRSRAALREAHEAIALFDSYKVIPGTKDEQIISLNELLDKIADLESEVENAQRAYEESLED